MTPPIFVPDSTVEYKDYVFLAGPHPRIEGSRVLVAPAGVLGPTFFQCSYGGQGDLARTVEEAVERMCLMAPYWYYKAVTQKWGHN